MNLGQKTLRLNQINVSKPDIVIVKFWLPFMGPCFGSILRRVRRNKTSKIVCIVDNIIPHESRFGDKIFTKYFVKSVDGFIAMSENVFQDLDKFIKHQPKILSPHPLFDNFGTPLDKDTALEKLNLPKGPKYMLFFGLIRKYKGLDLLLKALADDGFRKMNIKLIIAGEYYADKSDYTDLIKNHNLEDLIINVDKFIPDSEVRDYFCAADLVVQPYKSATQSGVTQIAYHFNKPMIVTNVGGLKELIPDGKAGYVVPTNPEDIRNAIFTFFKKDANGLQVFHDGIQIEKKKYSWGILVENLVKLASGINKNNS